MNPDDAFRHYQELQAYVGWTDEAGRQVAAASELVAPYLAGLVDDFYDEIGRHPKALKVITGGAAQIARLKGTLLGWLKELFCGRYDSSYVARRWRVGWRHVEIGLDQVYTNVALSRLRTGLVRTLHQHWQGDEEELRATVRSLNTLLDLDLALIEDAYQAEYASRLQASERLAALGQVALARERSEAAFRTLVEAAPCLIVILRPDHTVIYFSPFAEVLTGCAASAILGGDFLTNFLPEEHRPAAAERFQRALEGSIFPGSETPVLCRDGSLRWLLLNARPLPDPPSAFAALPCGGAAVSGPAVLLVGQDITTLKQAQERTLQAERLAAIGQMVAGLAHESGNALARSQACLEMLLLEVQDRPEALDLAGRIQNAQDHLRQLYEEVRNYAAPLRLERQLCGLDKVWRQAWANLAVQRQGRVARLHEQTGGIDLRCSLDPFRLEQVFRNILENALAACRDPVAITIACQATALHGQAAVCVSVRDNGPGLNAEQRQRLFEPFYTTKTKGTGLGMAIARRIVEAHGGTLVAGRAEPSGADIQLTLARESP